MGEFQTAQVQPLGCCGNCLATAHSLVPGPVQVECLDAEQWDEEQWDEEQWDGECLVQELQTALVQSSHRCGISLATAHSSVPRSVQLGCLGESQVHVDCLDEEQWGAEHLVEESRTTWAQSLPRGEVCV